MPFNIEGHERAVKQAHEAYLLAATEAILGLLNHLGLKQSDTRKNEELYNAIEDYLR